MSKQNARTLNCPKCGAENQVILWDSVNVTLDPEMKARILEGDFFRHECQSCNCLAGLVYPFLYHDMDRKLMVYLIPDGERTEEQERELRSGRGMDLLPMADEMDYAMRIVGSPSDLMEKIKIFDASKDDRVIEISKFVAFSYLMEQVPDFKAVIAYFEKGENGEAMLVFFDQDGKALASTLSEELYQDLEKEFRPKISERSGPGFEIIDQLWAMSTMNEE